MLNARLSSYMRVYTTTYFSSMSDDVRSGTGNVGTGSKFTVLGLKIAYSVYD